MNPAIFVPNSEREMLDFLETEGEHSSIVSGATDLLPRIQRHEEKKNVLINISRLKTLRYTKKENGIIRIGALSTIADLSKTELLGPEYEAFKKLATIFGSPPVRNLATVGGNLAACSSSEDLIPIFLTLDAKVKLRCRNSERELQLSEFVVAKRETSRKKNEILAEVSFPEMAPHSWCSFEKVGRRERLVISLVSLACVLTLNPKLDRIEQAKIALNRVYDKIPRRTKKTEQVLLDRTFDDALLHDAATSLASELVLTSDFRATDTYRTRIATALLKRSLLHCKRSIENSEVDIL